MTNITEHNWLCRNCNMLVSEATARCPKCGADKPEGENLEQTPKDIPQQVNISDYVNNAPKVKDKFTLREAILVNAADILLIIGAFCILAALISPIFLSNIANIRLISICSAIVIFAISTIQWSLLRTVADISRRLRNLNKEE